MKRIPLATSLAVVAVVMTAAATGAGATMVYDAQNAHKVDGFHAVGAGATLAQKAGKLVAADANGRLPDSSKLGGYTHRQMATMSIPVQAAYVSQGANMSRGGPVLSGTNGGEMTVGFVIPPDHKPGTGLTMQMVYGEDSPTACNWYVYLDGLEGPDAPNDQSNLHNAGWLVPGTSSFDGVLSVPDGAGSVFVATFKWPFINIDQPGHFVDFQLTRDGGNPDDTCGDTVIYGLQLSY